MDRCEECQFEYASEDESTIPDRLRTLASRYRAPLSRFLPGEDGLSLLRAHPIEGAWSALEYACHVRDVFQWQERRVALALAEDVPEPASMGRDQRAVDEGYNEQDPAVVAPALAANAEALATAFEALTPDQWARTVIYGYPERAERSLVWVGQHTVHEAHHHLLDVGRTMRVARGR